MGDIDQKEEDHTTKWRKGSKDSKTQRKLMQQYRSMDDSPGGVKIRMLSQWKETLQGCSTKKQNEEKVSRSTRRG